MKLGTPPPQMVIPERFTDYECADYFCSDMFTRGVWDQKSQLWVIVAADQVVEYPDLHFLAIGRPGCDGIEFGYRKEYDGLWAYYPTSGEFIWIASDIAALSEGWLKGSIKV